ncbi:hypothetical protein SB761_34900, partial [Pseudomonas sp. SIMBA_064]
MASFDPPPPPPPPDDAAAAAAALAEELQRVRDAARALNWIPNAAGRALASTRTHITGAIIPTLDDQVFASQVAG